MNRGLTAGLILVSLSTGLAADNSKSALETARMRYREAVSKHGQRSPQASSARQDLRSARRNFHAERRQQWRQQRRSR